MYLVVYRCTDDGEEESCFLEECVTKASVYCAMASPPVGYENRPGYYFLEPHDGPMMCEPHLA